MARSENFESWVGQVKQPLIGSKQLSIWGGICPEDALLDFLQGWPLKEMPYRIWQFISEIRFERNTLPIKDEFVLLERGRLFGKGGDLELRRDGNVFRWRFVGKTEIHPPSGYDAENFWDSHPNIAFHCYTEHALLWGEREDAHWRDDRVAAAELSYPIEGAPQRVQVDYKVYSRAGRVEFVWFTDLSEWKE